jgi:hypothetical protein
MSDKPMTDDEKAAARKLCEEATPGEWRVGLCNSGVACWCRIVVQASDSECAVVSDGSVTRPDAEFIAAARMLVPRLLSEVDRLTAEVVAADERLLCAMDGTFAIGDGTAQTEIELLLADNERLMADAVKAHKSRDVTARLARAALRRSMESSSEAERLRAGIAALTMERDEAKFLLAEHEASSASQHAELLKDYKEARKIIETLLPQGRAPGDIDLWALTLEEIAGLRAELESIAPHTRDSETQPDASVLAAPVRCDCCSTIIPAGDSAVMFVDETGRECWAHYWTCPEPEKWRVESRGSRSEWGPYLRWSDDAGLAETVEPYEGALVVAVALKKRCFPGACVRLVRVRSTCTPLVERHGVDRG